MLVLTTFLCHDQISSVSDKVSARPSKIMLCATDNLFIKIEREIIYRPTFCGSHFAPHMVKVTPVHQPKHIQEARK